MYDHFKKYGKIETLFDRYIERQGSTGEFKTNGIETK